jgi:hypothetical protein
MALTAGLAKDCNPNSGGIQRIALANVADIDTISLDSGTSSFIDSIAMISTKTFFEFEAEQDSVEWRENGELVNGSLKYTEEIEMFFRKQNATTAAALREIGENLCGMVAAVKTTNGETFIVGWSENLGLERPLKLASDASTSGKELTDLSGGTITLAAMVDEKAYPTSVDVFGTLL